MRWVMRCAVLAMVGTGFAVSVGSAAVQAQDVKPSPYVYVESCPELYVHIE
jgi:hypothetical protein